MTTGAPRRPTVPVALAVCAGAAQLAYPLSEGGLRDGLTVAIVLLLAATCLAHAAVTRGGPFALTVFVVTALPALAVEVIGVHTGVPFGSYRYDGSLGPRLFEVPLVVGLAWTMLAWPAALAARVLVNSFAARVALGAWALATADLFLDPQLVASGHWRWAHPDPHLPGVPTVPLTNYAGWLLVSLALSALVQVVLRPHPVTGRFGVGLYVWLWAGWTVALACFLDLAGAAAWGAVAMGTVAVPAAARMTAIRGARR